MFIKQIFNIFKRIIIYQSIKYLKLFKEIYTECEAGRRLSVSVDWSHSGSTPQEPGTNTKTQNLYLMIWWLVQMTRYSTNQLWSPKSVSDVRLFYHFVDLKRNLVGICNHWQYMYKHEFQNRSSKKKNHNTGTGNYNETTVYFSSLK